MAIRSLKSTPIDELWSLYEQVISALARRTAEEKAKLEERLRRLGHSDGAIGGSPEFEQLNLGAEFRRGWR